MIDITIAGMGSLKTKLSGLPVTFKAALADRMRTMSDDLVQAIRDGKLSGQVLNDVSGRLKESITAKVSLDGDNLIEASVGVEGDVPYAAIQEAGGSTKAHVIMASQGKALAFNAQGKQAFFAHINHPGSQIPAHDYLGSALDDAQDSILDGMSETLGDVFAG